MNNNKTLDWYLAQIKPNSGAIAMRNLGRQGFDCFQPLEHHTRRQGKRLVSAVRPFFPGYLFVGIHAASTPWRALRSTQGVARLVGFGAEPTAVPKRIIEELMHSCDDDGFVHTTAQVSEGDEVRITHGSFAGLVGKVERVSSKERAWLLIDIMGKEARASVQRTDLRLAS